MKERTDRIAVLLEKWLRKELTPDENKELEAWLSEGEENKELFQQLTNEEQLLERLHDFDRVNSSAIWEKTMSRINPGARVVPFQKKKITWYKYVAAAVVVLAISGTIYVMVSRPVDEQVAKTDKQDQVTPAITEEVVPGGKKAVLTLADGVTVELDKNSGGALPQQGDMRLSRSDGHIIYDGRFISTDPVSTGSSEHALHNMVSTPRGGQYQITLPDGSKVWLNAASSLRFPLAFAGNQREVVLTGEAYFEVAKLSMPGSNKRMPFIVKLTNAKNENYAVEVLGTKFGVKGYNDETEVKTALLEGSVRIITDKVSKKLRPGYVAISQNGETTISKEDIASHIKWKDGKLALIGSIESVLNQIARWYDVTIEYKDGKIPVGNVSADLFEGSIPLDSKLTDVLGSLDKLHITTRLENRKIIVSQ